tara:strand:- start:7845 stop:8306 length:462 start_codon:yes stop_codon:yes gene_type:complete
VYTRYEITGKFEEPADCNALLYAPLSGTLSYRQSRSYEFDFGGPVDRLTEFVRKCLLDEISQDLSTGAEPWSDFAFVLDYGMKPGALDLEKEAVLNYYRSLEDPGFELESLAIRHRIYVFGEASKQVVQQFERDIVNRAIHNWNIQEKSLAAC